MVKCGLMVVLVSGVAVKRNRELLDGRWDKHDAKDSANVADLVSQGKCLFYEYPMMWLRDLRGLLSLKRRLKKQELSSLHPRFWTGLTENNKGFLLKGQTFFWFLERSGIRLIITNFQVVNSKQIFSGFQSCFSPNGLT